MAEVTHRTAQQRARARKAQPLGGKPAQLAPSLPVVAVVCATCSHPRLIHRDGGRCLTLRCECTGYVEAPDA